MQQVMRWGSRRRAGICILLSAASVGQAMVFDRYDPQRHDRLDSSAFIGAAHDWSGVGRSSDGRWATLIDRDIILCANHLHPEVNAQVTFRETNLSTGPTVVRSVTDGVRIGNTDFWIGLLDSPVPPEITSYALATGTPQSRINSIAYTVGLVAGQVAIGLNAIDIFGNGVLNPNGSFDVVGFVQNLAGDPNFIPNDETFGQSGDSGGPSFIETEEGSLVLVGLHSFIVNDHDVQSIQGNRNLTVDNFVGSYVDEIASAIDQLRPVPVPASPAMFSDDWRQI